MHHLGVFTLNMYHLRALLQKNEQGFYLFVFFANEIRDSNREQATVSRALAEGKKTVLWTVLRVWSPQSENPVGVTKKEP